MTRRAADALVANTPSIISSNFVSAKLLPLAQEGRPAILTRPQPARLVDGLPTPPPELWQRWGYSEAEYLESGRQDVATMLDLLARGGCEPASFLRVLDIGCAEGRMLRAFPRSDASELWGVDINAERIAWAQQYLPLPFRFVVTTTAPHLPFEDNSFDLAYGLSLFTHISDLADAWFLEVVRILRPGAHAYLTIHDEHSVDLLLHKYGSGEEHAFMTGLVRDFDRETGVLGRDWVYFSVLADPAAQAFYDAAFLVEKWSRFADHVATEREACDYQTALIFRKRAV